jgi:hypothetical protein
MSLAYRMYVSVVLPVAPTMIATLGPVAADVRETVAGENVPTPTKNTAMRAMASLRKG